MTKISEELKVIKIIIKKDNNSATLENRLTHYYGWNIYTNIIIIYIFF